MAQVIFGKSNDFLTGNFQQGPAFSRLFRLRQGDFPQYSSISAKLEPLEHIFSSAKAPRSRAISSNVPNDFGKAFRKGSMIFRKGFQAKVR
jgi:hypothetical protein